MWLLTEGVIGKAEFHGFLRDRNTARNVGALSLFNRPSNRMVYQDSLGGASRLSFFFFLRSLLHLRKKCIVHLHRVDRAQVLASSSGKPTNLAMPRSVLSNVKAGSSADSSALGIILSFGCSIPPLLRRSARSAHARHHSCLSRRFPCSPIPDGALVVSGPGQHQFAVASFIRREITSARPFFTPRAARPFPHCDALHRTATDEHDRKSSLHVESRAGGGLSDALGWRLHRPRRMRQPYVGPTPYIARGMIRQIIR